MAIQIETSLKFIIRLQIVGMLIVDFTFENGFNKSVRTMDRCIGFNNRNRYRFGRRGFTAEPKPKNPHRCTSSVVSVGHFEKSEDSKFCYSKIEMFGKQIFRKNEKNRKNRN